MLDWLRQDKCNDGKKARRCLTDAPDADVPLGWPLPPPPMSSSLSRSNSKRMKNEGDTITAVASAVAHRDTTTTNDNPLPSLSLSLPLRISLLIEEDMLLIWHCCQRYDDDLISHDDYIQFYLFDF